MEKVTMEMTTQELAEYEAFMVQKRAKEAAEKAEQDRETYKELVDEAVMQCFPNLEEVSKKLSRLKKSCYDVFSEVIDLKSEVYGIKAGQKSHTFTHRELPYRITLGNYENDNYDDTAEIGIAMIKEDLSSLAKDQDSQLLVDSILQLLSKDQRGNLKASRVIQLGRIARDSGRKRLIEGVDIIEAAYRPQISKTYVKAEFRNEQNEWKSIPLGMTEAE